MHPRAVSIGRLSCLLIGSALLWAQDRQVVPPPSPLAPTFEHYPPELVATVGIGWGWQQGAFRGSCSHDFTNGRSTAWLLSIGYSSPLIREWLWGISFLVTQFQLSASYREREAILLASQTDTVSVPVETRSRAQLQAATLGLWGYIRWRPTEWLVLSAGPSVQVPLSPRFRHEKELLQDQVTLPTGEQLQLTAAGSSLVEAASFSGRLHWGALLHAGIDVPIERRWWISFGLHTMVGLSPLLASPATVRLLQWYASLSVGRAW
jgi:hypothetical protein